MSLEIKVNKGADAYSLRKHLKQVATSYTAQYTDCNKILFIAYFEDLTQLNIIHCFLCDVLGIAG